MIERDIQKILKGGHLKNTERDTQLQEKKRPNTSSSYHFNFHLDLAAKMFHVKNGTYGLNNDRSTHLASKLKLITSN